MTWNIKTKEIEVSYTAFVLRYEIDEKGLSVLLGSRIQDVEAARSDMLKGFIGLDLTDVIKIDLSVEEKSERSEGAEIFGLPPKEDRDRQTDIARSLLSLSTWACLPTPHEIEKAKMRTTNS